MSNRMEKKIKRLSVSVCLQGGHMMWQPLQPSFSAAAFCRLHWWEKLSSPFQIQVCFNHWQKHPSFHILHNNYNSAAKVRLSEGLSCFKRDIWRIIRQHPNSSSLTPVADQQSGQQCRSASLLCFPFSCFTVTCVTFLISFFKWTVLIKMCHSLSKADQKRYSGHSPCVA